VHVLFVNMPFGSAVRPPIGVGLLKGQLASLGIPARVENLNQKFAELIGHSAYQHLAEAADASKLAGDWAFVPFLFPHLDRVREDYYRLLAPDTLSAVQSAQAAAQTFLAWCVNNVDWQAYCLVGFTTSFAQNIPSLALARRVKERFPSTLIAFGGANCEHRMGLALHRAFSFIDYVFTGEADLALPALVKQLTSRTVDPSTVPGVVMRSGSESLYSTLSPERVRDLDDLPYPDYDEFFPTPDSTAPRVLTMETSRGCWWGDKHHCTFCGIDFPSKYRSKSPGRAIAELSALRDRYRASSVLMTDAILDLRYFRGFFQQLADLDPPMTVFYETKANLTEEQVALLSRAGARYIQPGIESLSTAILQLMRKGTTASRNIQFLKWCRTYGVSPIWNLLYGFPGEPTEAYGSMATLIRSLYHLEPPNGCGPISLVRFSPYFERAAEFGIINVRAARSYSYVYDLPPDVISDLAYYFEFEFADGRSPEAYCEETRAAVEDWQAHHDSSSLSYDDDGTVLTIHDSREGDVVHHLDTWKRELYLYCDDQPPSPRVLERATQLKVPRAEVLAFLAFAVDQRLMALVDERYVSLALPAAVIQPPPLQFAV
jgi:ribosomal peptide maturation radical SAM protein 1